MKKLQITQPKSITFGEGCELYLTNCKQRNLREGTIRHYRQSYLQFYKFFNEDMPLEDFTQTLYNDYVLHLRETLHNDVSINSYLRDLTTTLRFLMQEDYLKPFQMKSIKVDKTQVETYIDDELKKLLQTPNLKKCSFIEYQSWVMTNFLFATGVRQSMSRNGNCLDNAVMENFFGLLKSDLLYLQDFGSLEHFKAEPFEYLDYYNNRRIKLKLKGLIPAQHRHQTLQAA